MGMMPPFPSLRCLFTLGHMLRENPGTSDSSPAKENRPPLVTISRAKEPGVEGTSSVALTEEEPKMKCKASVPAHLGSKPCSHHGLKLSTKIPMCSHLVLGGELTRVSRAEIFPCLASTQRKILLESLKGVTIFKWNIRPQCQHTHRS